jgi:hypothetical protein
VGFGLAADYLVELGDLSVPLVEQAQQVVAPVLGPRRKRERLEPLAPVLAPQLSRVSRSRKSGGQG